MPGRVLPVSEEMQLLIERFIKIDFCLRNFTHGSLAEILRNTDPKRFAPYAETRHSDESTRDALRVLGQSSEPPVGTHVRAEAMAGDPHQGLSPPSLAERPPAFNSLGSVESGRKPGRRASRLKSPQPQPNGEVCLSRHEALAEALEKRREHIVNSITGVNL
jgi:hypothetical protein